MTATNRATLRLIAKTRIKSSKILLGAGDWDGAAYMMGYALECALKAAACKTLRIEDYPVSHKDKKVPELFMTHSFERLLLLSGLSDIFNVQGDVPAFNNWSTFTINYPGEWTTIRYRDPAASPFDEQTTKKLIECLCEDENSIIKTISKRKRW